MNIDEAAEKIKNMEIRGAAKIAVFAVRALRDFALNVEAEDEFDTLISRAATKLLDTRPTAVSLYNGIHYVMKYSGITVNEKKESIKSLADEFIERAERANEQIGRIGEKRIKNGSTLMTHCNSSAALSIIKTAFRKGKKIEVYVTESRPRKQGLITLKELDDEGIPTKFIVDSAVRYFMKDVDMVVVGADTITANGTLINKIGTSQIALAAHEARVPFIVAAETFKFSPKTLHGELVSIEEREASEVLEDEVLDKYSHVTVRNPAFDTTPREYIDLIITEVGAIPPEMAYVIIREYLGYALEEFEG
jgi:ribose 1,5-bisphosphate isomerase